MENHSSGTLQAETSLNVSTDRDRNETSRNMSQRTRAFKHVMYSHIFETTRQTYIKVY